MKGFLGFVAGVWIITTITRPTRTKALIEAMRPLAERAAGK